MTIPSFLKRKSTYVILALVVATGGYVQYRRSVSSAPVFETAAVERKTLTQTVEVTGEIRPSSRIELAFKRGGTVSKINVKVGDQVKASDVLAELKADDLRFAMLSAQSALSIAQANYQARAAGETKESIRVTEAQLAQAQAAADKAVRDAEAARRTTADAVQQAVIAQQTAKNNLDNAGAIADQNVRNAYDSVKTQFLTALGPLQTGLTDGDQISGVDNTASNQLYGNALGYLDAGALDRSKSSYHMAKDAKATAESAVKALTSASSKDAIQAAGEKLQDAINAVQTYLTDVQKVLAASITNTVLTDTVLAAKKSTIDGDRTTVSSQSTAVLGALQTLKNTELTRTQTIDQLQNAYANASLALQTAQTNAEVQVKAADTNVEIQNAALAAAQAGLDLKKAGPRVVDLAPLRASVEQAVVAYEKAKLDLLDAQIVAPTTGTVSEVLPEVGETAAASAPVVRMVGQDMPDIEALVPEADVAKVALGQTAEVTLDAYGDDVKFKATVSAKDPAETKVQEAVYYKIRVLVDPAGKDVKPGMTANVTIKTGEATNVLVIPLRAVRTKEGDGKAVRVLVNGQPVEKTVELGLRGDEGRVEIKTGIAEGDKVIVGEPATVAK